MQHYVAGQWFSLGTPVSSTNRNIDKLLLKVAFKHINPQSSKYHISVPINNKDTQQTGFSIDLLVKIFILF
jgi:hypothetical protein